MPDNTTITRQPGAADLIARQPIAARTLTRQPVRNVFARNPRFEDGGAAPFDPTTYGTVISAHSARDQAFVDGASVPSITGYGPAARVVTAPAGSNEATFAAAAKRYDFDGNDIYRAPSRSPYDPLHQTPQGTVVVRFTPVALSSGVLQTFFSTSSFSSSSRGVIVSMDDRSAVGGGNKLRLFIPRAVGGTSVYDTLGESITPTLVAGTPTILTYAWDSSTAHIYQDGGLLGSDTASGDPPSALTSTALPEVGGSQGNFELVDGLHDLIVFSNKLGAAGIASLTAALEAEYA